MNVVDQIAKLLKSESIEKQIAAAIVIAELRLKGPTVVSLLDEALGSGVPLLQRHALVALSRVGARKALPAILPLLMANDLEVRRAATTAVASMGEEVIPALKARLVSATTEEKRAVDAVLAELGGKNAFSALLAGLASSDEEAARGAAIAVRQRVKDSLGSEHRSYLAQVEKFLAQQKKSKVPSETSIAAALKILGYLEDEKTIPLLLAYVSAKKEPSLVRQEAMIALRFALGQKKAAPKVVEALLDIANESDRALATTALHTLGSLEIPSTLAKKLEKLVAHPDAERARFVLEHLGRQSDEESAKILVRITTSADRERGQWALTAVANNVHAPPLLARALLDETDKDRAWKIGNVVRPAAKRVPKALVHKLLDEALSRIGKGDRGWEPLLDVARAADPEHAAMALRELAGRLKKTHPEKSETVFSILCRSDKATTDDRYQLAALLLKKSRRDTRREVRTTDESLRQLAALATRGFDVAAALRKDRGLGLEDLFYVGFHFVEEEHPAGRDLLQEVVKKGGRAKIAKMAKNKLGLTA